MTWKFPEDVKGWLSEAEGRKLAELARGKRVLEIGCFHGRSTICIGQTAASLDCIDPMDGRGTPAPGNYISTFKANVTRYKVGARLYVGTTEDCAPDLDPGYDLIFIDGDHSRGALATDIKEARRLLKPGGLVVFHDYESPKDPDVSAAVNRLVEAGAELLETLEFLAVLRLTPGETEKPVVLLTMPMRGSHVTLGAAKAYYHTPTTGRCTVILAHVASPILDYTMNRCFAAALNHRARGVTHWAMIHDDVCPDAGWLDTLHTEMIRHQADAISAVVPIKDARGMSSTAIETDDVWNPRRFSMTEIHDTLPETFGDQEAGGRLLLNTGLFLCDLRGSWTKKPPSFQTRCRLALGDDGNYETQVRSEDWEFSRAMRRLGCKLVATRKVGLSHLGENEYPNDHAWGDWATDKIHDKNSTATQEEALVGALTS